jgi:oligopeptide transport system ATP-binding protein
LSEQESDSSIVAVEDLVKHFSSGSAFSSILRRKESYVHAVDGVTFSIRRSETFCIVGESGSGKSTLALTILKLVEPTSGKIFFEGSEITRLHQGEFRALRKNMQIVFQDPSSSLDPRKTIFSSVSEPLRAHQKLAKSVLRERVIQTLKLVGLSESQIDYYPHQFSGGQRQRICIARALISQPKFLVLDEPTSALDASVQSQILVLLEKLQEELKLSYLLVTHNISVARYLADRIAVMYLGKIVEIGKNRDIISNPSHPYTQVLISSVLEPGPETKFGDLEAEGDIPNPLNPPPGCRFNTRCVYAREKCRQVEPDLRPIGAEGHYTACHFAEEIIALNKNSAK